MKILNKILILSFVAIGFFGFSSVAKAGISVTYKGFEECIDLFTESGTAHFAPTTNSDGTETPGRKITREDALKQACCEKNFYSDGFSFSSAQKTECGNLLDSGGGSGGGSTASKFCDTTKDFVFENGLCIPKNKFAANSLANSTSLTDLIAKVLKILLTFAGVAVVVAMVYGGYLYIMAAGNDEMAEKGKNALINSTIGLIIILLAYALVNILVTLVTK